MRTLAYLTPLLIVLGSAVNLRADYAVRDGDTVVFLGDSITAARHYGKIIENYTLLRFPERKVRFINAGRGGETAKGSLARLNDAVFAQGATLLTVAYGINDIGWGTKADDAHRKDYLDAIAEIVDRCRQRNVRVFICSAAITAEKPETAEKGYLQVMCDQGLALAKSKGAGTIDVQRSMRQVQQRILAADAKQPDKSKHTRLHVEDGVHLNDLGQMAMAWAILKGLGAPAEVSSASVDATSASVIAADGCKISDVQREPDGLLFTRLDERLPLNLHPLWMLQGWYIPLSDDLNQYLLTVKGLPEGRYEMTAGGRALGKWSSAELARGINIASATADPWQPGGPWDGQGHALKVFTDMRDEVVVAQRGMTDSLQAHPRLRELCASAEAIEKELVKLQREVAQPVPVKFTLERVQ